MKKICLRLTCALLAVCSAVVFAACNGENAEKTETTAATAAATETPATEAPTTVDPASLKKETDLTALHAPVEKGDLFSGYWKISDGSGSQYESFVYSFDGSSKAYLLIGTYGFIGVYEVHVKDGKDVFSTKLMFGLNGDYTYEFSKDKQSAVLTNVETNQTTTITKLDNYNPVPAPQDDFEIDEALLGAWVDDTGFYLYFDKNGIMYNCQKNISFTFFNYSASVGTISAVYSMPEPNDETDTYKLDGEKLIYNGNTFTRISADELL